VKILRRKNLCCRQWVEKWESQLTERRNATASLPERELSMLGGAVKISTDLFI